MQFDGHTGPITAVSTHRAAGGQVWYSNNEKCLFDVYRYWTGTGLHLYVDCIYFHIG